MVGLTDTLRSSRPIQVLLIALAAALTLLPLLAEKLQGNSIRWTADNDQVHCEYFRVPSFSHVRSYDHAKILDVTSAPDSTEPSIEVVRFRFNGLNYNIPSQSEATIWRFDAYLAALQRFVADARSGNQDASLVWYHPWLMAGVGAAVAAGLMWIVVFTVLLLGPKRPRVTAADVTVEGGGSPER